MDLAELERAVQRQILDGGPLQAALVEAVAPPAAERWEIYIEAYRIRLTEALAAQYPALEARAGREAFTAQMRDFIAATPSVHRSIRDYGSELAAHLAAGAADLEDEMCAELAAFEWLLAAAFDAASATPATVADLAGVAPGDWPELRFRPIPGLARLVTQTNAVALWRATRTVPEPGGEAAAPAAPAAARSGRTDWLIYRSGLDTQFRSLGGDEAAALDDLLAGGSFGELCASLAEAADDAGSAALQAASFLKGWLMEGILERL